jgi:mono/diheme cytochrome c family protein
MPTLAEVKALGRSNSAFLGRLSPPPRADSESSMPQARLAEFRSQIAPVLKQNCVECHGPKKQKGKFRVDTLDPNLLHGEDVNWWLEVFDVLSNGEMPPEDDDVHLADEDRRRVIDWLSSEMQVASKVRRHELGHSSFRRMTRYEYSYALQDLLGLPYDFAKDLPPETASEDGFKNSSEMLQMSAMQFHTYREIARSALLKATVSGERPEPSYYDVSMKALSRLRWKDQETRLNRVRKAYQDDPEQLKRQLEKATAKYAVRSGNAHFRDLNSGRRAKASWSYGNAKNGLLPSKTRPEVPNDFPIIAVVPMKQSLTVDLRDTLPDTGILRVRVLAARTSPDSAGVPTLRLFFGHQASNNSKASEKVGGRDIEINAPPENAQFYHWDVPLSEVIRNPYRNVTKLGTRPNPAEFVRLVNTGTQSEDVQISYIEVIAPAYDQWPPETHTRIFLDSKNNADDASYAREVLARFMTRAWRRPIAVAEIDQKLALFAKIRTTVDGFQEAMIEVLAGVLASPHFLYLVQSEPGTDLSTDRTVTDSELATRLTMFLWSSVPDAELRHLAVQGKLRDSGVLIDQTKRLLADPRARRFSQHFVRQWLGMQLLDYLDVDKKVYRQFDDELKEAMQKEPIAFFQEALRENRSVIDFLHTDHALVNERLARHYGLPGVYGNHFRRVSLKPEHRRGGLLTQAGLLAMNSDGKDSHPLKRGIWLLENLLNDPPPPPPPAVPEIDLTDPDILKLTLKKRMEDHRNNPACMSCHAKIDPWGIAFENFDATGTWRSEINDQPVDAASVLFNKQELHGMDGLKRFLLANRQDQFARAMVHKLAAYALGRPLTFADRSSVDLITTDIRRQGDGLATLVTLIATSDLFQSK